MKILKVEQKNGENVVLTFLKKSENRKINLNVNSVEELEQLYSVLEVGKIKFSIIEKDRKKRNEGVIKKYLTPGISFKNARKMFKENSNEFDKELAVFSKSGFGLLIGSKKCFVVLRDYSDFISSSALLNLARQVAYWLNKLDFETEEEKDEQKEEDIAGEIVENIVQPVVSNNKEDSFRYSLKEYLSDLNELIEFTSGNLYIPERALSHSFFETITKEDVEKHFNDKLLKILTVEDTIKLMYIKEALYTDYIDETGKAFVKFFGSPDLQTLFLNLSTFLIEPAVFIYNGFNYGNAITDLVQKNSYGEFIKINTYSTISKSVEFVSELYDSIRELSSVETLTKTLEEFLNKGENVKDLLYEKVEKAKLEKVGAPQKVFNAERFVITTKLRI